MSKNLAIYIHYPFCESKCPYCDFNSHVKDSIDHESYKKAYLAEIDYFFEKIDNKPISSIFFGGGTPSLMSEDLLESILGRLHKKFSIDQNVEITLEANPSSFEAQKFQNFKNLGINRLSIGVQSFDDENLKFLGRKHDVKEAIKAIENASNIFENFSFDLIYSLPEQKINDWLNELKYALSFQTKHLSLYQLTIEKGTPFFSDYLNKKFTMPSDDISCEFFEKTVDLMENSGFENYEISNFAKKGFECKHNLNYWQGVDYIGIGAGAHGRLYLKNEKERSAIVNFHKPEKWLKDIHTSGSSVQKIEKISKQGTLEELLLMGLRLKDGIRNELFLEHFNKNILQLFNLKRLQRLSDLGLIEFSESFLRINPRKRILANEIVFKVCEAIL